MKAPDRRNHIVAIGEEAENYDAIDPASSFVRIDLRIFATF